MGWCPASRGSSPRLIRSEQSCLVLLDLVLPGKDGIELMREVPELSDLPVIFISGYGRDETVAGRRAQVAPEHQALPAGGALGGRVLAARDSEQVAEHHRRARAGAGLVAEPGQRVANRLCSSQPPYAS